MNFEIVLRNGAEERHFVRARDWAEAQLIARRLEAVTPSFDPQRTSISELGARSPEVKVLNVEQLVTTLFIRVHTGTLAQRREFHHFAAPVADFSLVYPYLTLGAVRESKPQTVMLIGAKGQDTTIARIWQAPTGAYGALVTAYVGSEESCYQGCYRPGEGWTLDRQEARSAAERECGA